MAVKSVVQGKYGCYDEQELTDNVQEISLRRREEMRKNIKQLKKIRVKAGAAAMALLLGAGSAVNAGIIFAGAAVVYAQEDTPAESESRTVIGEATQWKYLDDNTDPAEGAASLSAWTGKDFDDSAWKAAAGKFGAKKGQLTPFDGFTPTVLLQQYKPDENGVDIPTYFFRTTFQVEKLEELTSVVGTIYHDDAAAVYLNGNKILSVDMPADTQTSNMFYAGVSAGAPKEAAINLDTEQIQNYMVEGENVLAVELHNDRAGSSDIYFEFADLTLNYNEAVEGTPEPENAVQKSVILTVGSDEAERNVTWYTDTAQKGEVQYAKKANMVNGEFPETYLTAEASSTLSNDEGFYSNQAVMPSLDENTEYVYRLKNGEAISEVYSFSTGDFNGEFSFALVGDPQIGAGSTPSDIEGWNQTLDVITSKINPDFMVSAGDQVNTASNEDQYAGYLNGALSSLASAATIGNHDSGSAAYGEHFSLPNESADKGITNAGSDYWFVYNNTLFMDINSNNRSTAEHKAFLEEAIAANPDVTWKTVIFHHSIYSTASHVNDSDIITRREELPQVFADLDIDVVLMGHDHVYTRTYMMNGFTPDTSQGVQSSVTDPTGILYLTVNSASGSKYYDVKAPNAEYAAKQDQSYRRTVTDVTVNETSYTMTTYYADDMSLLDTFTIYKTPETDKSALEEAVNKADALMDKESDYTAETWKTFAEAYASAVEVLDDEKADQETIDQACRNLENAIADLKKAADQPSDNNGNQNAGNQNNGGQSGSNNQSSGGQNSSGQSVDKKVGSRSPKTGDSTNAAIMILLMAGAGSAIIVSTKKRRNV